ncbi:MAG: DUF3604 domain-containing protein [Acidobacteriota bacterium]
MRRTLFLLVWLGGFAGILAWSSPEKREDGKGDDGFWEELERAIPKAFSAYDRRNDPSVEMTGPREISHSAYGEWTFTFTAGAHGLSPGAALAIATRHVAGWGATQNFDPSGPNYVTVEAPPSVTVRLNAENQRAILNSFFYEYFAWQHFTTVEIVKGKVQPGGSIRLVFGDRSVGSPGYRVPAVARKHAVFLPLVRRGGGEQYLPIPARLSVAILPSETTHFSVVVPSDAVVGRPLQVLVRAEDDQGNVAASFRGRVRLVAEGGPASLPESIEITPQEEGIYRLQDVRFLSPGICRIQVIAERNRNLSGRSNPSRSLETEAEFRVFWGDFHAHSILSDGTGTTTQAYHYARDVAGLDFFGLSDHGYQMDETRWKINETVTTRFHDPPRFATFYGYEWSGMTDVGGDHNVMYARPGMPVYRSNSYYEPKNPFIYSGPELDAPHIVQLYKRFALLAAQTNARILAFPSIRGRIANPQWNDERFSPVVEVVSEAGWYERLALEFLRRGNRLGFVGSSDDHYGRPGYGMADKPDLGYSDASGTERSRRRRFAHPWGKTVLGSPLMAVLATENDREPIFDAIFNRRTYATTGARILLDFRAGRHRMGEEFSASDPPHFTVEVRGTAPLHRIRLKKDGEVVFEEQFSREALDAEVSWIDSKDYKGHFYYAVIDQIDGQRAVSSPIWVD